MNYMSVAEKLAFKALKKGEVPVGAVIVRKNKIIGKGYNKKERKKSSIYHAEIIAIKNAGKKIKNWRLDDCELFCTMEPCMMCCGAIIQSRIKKVYYLLENHNFGCTELLKKCKIEVIKINEKSELKDHLINFFKKKRF